MTTYTGVNGTIYTPITPALGKGGEGTVYKLSGMPNYVLKVFLDQKRTETRRKKLLAMISTPLSKQAMEQVTWPIDVVSSNGQFMGYVMPFIKNNEPLNVIYSDKYSCTLSEKITIAKNLCAAVNAIHNAGQVCGDLNPNNIQVDPNDSTITLVDADSYHIKEKSSDRLYRCEVGLPEYLAREVQVKMKNGTTLSNAPLPTFTVYTDLFALAVHIFALLMNGCHPFACAVNGKDIMNRLSFSQVSVVAPQPIDNIKNGYFPFHTLKPGITHPIYAPDFMMLPLNIRTLFIRAFVNGHSNPSARPNCVEWHSALANLQTSLKTCSVNRVHMYPSNCKTCPFCQIENNMNKKISQAASKTPITVAPVKKTYRNTYTNNTQNTTNRQPKRNYSNSSSDSFFESTATFFIVTLLVATVGQYFLHEFFSEPLIEWVFGDGEKEGWKNFLINFAANIGMWGFIVSGLICSLIYNFIILEDGSYFGFEFVHYFLSILCIVAGNILWPLLVYGLSIGIQIILAIIIISFFCGSCSGS